MILSLIEIALAVAAGVLTWRLNLRITRMQNRTVRISLHILLNVVAVIVIVLLLMFGLLEEGDSN